MLAGVAQALIEENLAAVGLTSETRPVRLEEIADFDGAFICNSATPACAVTAIGERLLNTDPETIGRLAEAWAMAPAETI